MKFLKHISVLFFSLILIQCITFHKLAKTQLLKSLAENYETNIFDFNNNQFDNIHFVSELPLTTSQIQKYFKLFNNKKITCCKSFKDCPHARIGNFYIYGIFLESDLPFSFVTISEIEFAESFGSDWESTYVWILFKWHFIEKVSKGIS
ncbi:MAG: hypothetical protein ACI8YQ_004520 [Polaribacter sp.]|jgi:hypothetical protein